MVGFRATVKVGVQLPMADMQVLQAQETPLWWEGLPTRPTRDPLPGDVDADVAIVGAGFTGLWTAYYLKSIEPSLNVVVVESRRVGFGASSRNGGWCHAAYPLGISMLVRDYGKEEGVRFKRLLNGVVPEVGRVVAAEGIDCHFQQGGRILIARDELHLDRARSEVAAYHRLGFTEDDIRLLDEEEAAEFIGATGLRGAAYSHHAAAVQPAALAHGLAGACERRGVRIFEQTAAERLNAGEVITNRGTVRARRVIRATEGYSRDLNGLRRTLVPLYSHMIATEPLPESVWDGLKLRDRTVFGDYSPSLIYGQRTHDGRLAFGGRGAPYHWNSGIRAAFDVNDAVHLDLAAVLLDHFPKLSEYRISHRWGGPIGVSRDWRPSVTYSPETGMGWAGGYAGDGVAMTNLAGRTLADLILKRDTELVTLGWVNHAWRPWEPEPLRYLGINAGLWLAKSADREERRTGRPAWRAGLGDWLRGKRG